MAGVSTTASFPHRILAQERADRSPTATLARVVANAKKDEVKLRQSYRDIVTLYRQTELIALNLTRVNTQLLDKKLTKEVRAQLRENVGKLEAALREQQGRVASMEANFKTDQEALLTKLNETCALLLRALGSSDSTAELDDLFSVLAFGVLDDYKELPHLKQGHSFIDQPVWEDAVRGLSAAGPSNLPRLKKALLSSDMPAKYAVVAVVTQLGPAVDKADKGIWAELFKFKMRALLKKANLEPKERGARQAMLESAMESIRPER